MRIVLLVDADAAGSNSVTFNLTVAKLVIISSTLLFRLCVHSESALNRMNVGKGN